MRVPDFISPIVGWRVWQWDSAGLKSLNGEPWQPGKPLQAGCRDHAPGHSHDAPEFDCSCGIYAAKTLDHLRRTQFWHFGTVRGEVGLWGSVVQHEAGYRAEFAYPKTLHLPSETLAVTIKQIEVRIQSLIGYGCDLFIDHDNRTIPLWAKQSGVYAIGLDFLVSRGHEWYARRKHERTIKIGDRIAVLGRGIAVVEQVSHEHVHAVLWNREVLRLQRAKILWHEQNMRWETCVCL